MKVVAIPISINGDSTCFAPNIIKKMKLAKKIKKLILLNGLNCIPLDLAKSTNGIANNARIAANIAITPNSLLGIERNIA